MGPIRTGFFYGTIAVVVTVAISFRFVFLDPAGTADWVLAVSETFLPLVAVAAQLFFGVLAAIRVRPTRLDPDVPYRSLLLRDATLAAVVVAVMVGVTLIVTTVLQATVFAGEIRAYASEAAPEIVAYVNEAREDLSDPPEPATVAEVRDSLAPPVLADAGRSMANLVLRGLLLGFLGAAVGALRGRFGSGGPGAPNAKLPDR